MQLTSPHNMPRLLGKFPFIVFFLLASAEQEKIALDEWRG